MDKLAANFAAGLEKIAAGELENNKYVAGRNPLSGHSPGKEGGQADYSTSVRGRAAEDTEGLLNDLYAHANKSRQDRDKAHALGSLFSRTNEGTYVTREKTLFQKMASVLGEE